MPPSSPHISFFHFLFFSPLSISCLDNITAYYFSYFHPSLCPYRPVSQAVMCDLELSLQLWVSSVEVRWLVYWNLTGGVTLNKPTSPSSPIPPSSSDLCSVCQKSPVGVSVWWESACARWDVANDHLRVPPLILGGGFSQCSALCECTCGYTHFLSQPITVPRSRQQSPPSSSFCAIVLFPPPPSPASSHLSVWQGGVRGEPQPQVLLPWGVITPLWDSLSLTHTHAQSNAQFFSSVSFYLSRCHHVLQLSLALLLWGFDTHSHEHTHTRSHLILMFPLYLSLPSPQMWLCPLGFVYNRALQIEAESV